MILSKLICKARRVQVQLGTLKGNCIFCGQHTDYGHPGKLKTKFTGYSYLQSGEVICPYCYELYNNEEYRKKMWLATEHEFKTFKRNEAKEILLSSLPVPFAVYLTKTWKKQGWITLMDKVNYSTETFFVGLDYDIVFVEKQRLIEYLSLIQNLLEQGVTKKELATGQLRVRSLERIGMDRSLWDKIAMLAGDKLWDLCLFIS